MPFLIATSLGSAALGAGGSILNGILGANATKKAASTEAAGYNAATNAEEGLFNQAQSFLQPYLSGGGNALNSLQQILGIGAGGGGATSPILAMLGIGPNGATGGGINPATFQGSPGYQFAKQQGLQGVTNSAAANGGLGGNALKALDSYGTGLANNTWDQYLSQANTGWNSLTNNLQSLTGLGANAGNALAGDAINLGGQIGNNAIGAATATGSGTLGATNALTGGINGLIQSLITGGNSPGGGQGLQALIAALSGSNGSGNLSTYFNPVAGTSYQSSSDPGQNF